MILNESLYNMNSIICFKALLKIASGEKRNFDDGKIWTSAV